MKRGHGSGRPARSKDKVPNIEGTEGGLVVATHGRHVVVEDPDGERLICHPRGKKSEAVVGDRVRWQHIEGGDEGVIVAVDERRNLLWRQDEWRSKSFAANLDQLLMWIAVEPVFSEMQLTRALIAARSADIPVTIVLNKVDLPGADTARQRLAPYRAMGYNVVELSLKDKDKDKDKDKGQGEGDAAREQVLPMLQGKASLVLGPSGAGKSTLINTLLPDARAEVGEISQALNSGRHTTTSSLWYWLDDSRTSAVIDSPGFQEFGLHHIQPTELVRLMPDLSAHFANCRFHNCTHRQEPGCAVRAAVERGEVSPIRLSLYTDLFEELSQPRW